MHHIGSYKEPMNQLQNMRVFAKVVEAGSFIAASEALGISRPMVSKHVARLEYDLGVKLLNRTTRTTSVTEAGRAFYARCLDIFARLDEAVQEASNLRIEPKGQLRISASHSFGRQHLTRSIVNFQKAYPDIEIDLTLNDRMIDLVDEGFDLAIRIGHLADSALIARKLGNCALTLCAAPSYLETHGIPKTPKDLSDHNCLVYCYLAEGKSWAFTKDGKVHTAKVSGNFQANSGDAVVEAAVSGLGIVLEPSFLTSPYLKSGKLVQLLGDYEIPQRGIYAVYPQDRLLPQKTRVFIDFLVGQYGEQPYWDDWE